MTDNLTDFYFHVVPSLVLFDMDGTLLDLAFDNYIWLQRVPQIWAEKHHCSLQDAKTHLYQFYVEHQGSLNWYSSKFWQQQLGIDVLKIQYQHRALIQPRACCFELLTQLNSMNIDCWLVTNADLATLQLKLESIPLRPYFKQMISSESLGYPKEDQRFWQKLQQLHPFQPHHTGFIDDNYDVLKSAQDFGISQLYSIEQPDSSMPREHRHADFIHLHQLDEFLEHIANTKELQDT